MGLEPAMERVRSAGRQVLDGPVEVPGGAWNHVVLKVSPTSHRFWVTINGVGVAACTNAPTTLGTPYKGIGVLDPSNAGYGGTTDWDNFVAS